jgi:hypothetical protein
VRTWDPNAWNQDPKKWGSAGLIWNGTHAPGSLTNGGSGNGWNFDPKYVQSVQDTSSEGSGGTNSFQATDYLNGLLGGKVQVRDINRLKDRNAVTDGGDEVGWLTDPSNYTDDTDWVDKAFEIGSMGLIAGPSLLHAFGVPQGSWADFSNHFSGNGLSGGDLPHGTEMPNTYAPNANPTSFYEPLGPGPELDLVGAGPGAALEGGVGATSGGLLGGGLEGALSGLLRNPMQLLGLLSMGSGLLGGGSSGGSPGGSSGPSNPMQLKTNRGAFTPNAHTTRQLQNFKWAGK